MKDAKKGKHMAYRLHECRNAGKALKTAQKGRLEALFRCFERDACPHHIHASGAVYCAQSPFFKAPEAERRQNDGKKEAGNLPLLQ